MISISEVIETNKMIQDENLDVRTITMGISLLDCADSNLDVVCKNIYAKLLRYAGKLVKTGIGHLYDTDVRFDGAEGIVGRLCACSGQCIKKGTLSHVRKSYDT